jgi:hypothetical protein
VLSSGGRGFERMVCVDASDSSDLNDCVDLSDFMEEALIGCPGGYCDGRIGGDSGIMRRGRIAIGVGLGADGVGMLKVSDSVDLAELVVCMRSASCGMDMGGAERFFSVAFAGFEGSSLDSFAKPLADS